MKTKYDNSASSWANERKEMSRNMEKVSIKKYEHTVYKLYKIYAISYPLWALCSELFTYNLYRSLTLSFRL